MTVFNIKIHSKCLLISLATVSVALAAACAIAAVNVSSSVPRRTATSDEIGEYSLVVGESGEDEFLSNLGYTPSNAETETENVVIPSDFNEYYESYNDLQKHMGLDLTKYRGKTAEKRTVWLDSPKNAKAVLLVYDGCVIGGHLTTGEYGSMDLPLA